MGLPVAFNALLKLAKSTLSEALTPEG